MAGLFVANSHFVTSDSMKAVIETLSIFLLLWIIVGNYIIYNAQSQIKRWAQQEHEVVGYQSQLSKQNELSKKYQKLYDGDSNSLWTE